MHKFINLILAQGVQANYWQHEHAIKRGICVQSPVIYATLQANKMQGMWAGYVNTLLTLPVIYFCHIN